MNQRNIVASFSDSKQSSADAVENSSNQVVSEEKSKKMSNTNGTVLPPEVLIKIFSFLDFKTTQKTCTLVCLRLVLLKMNKFLAHELESLNTGFLPTFSEIIYRLSVQSDFFF